MEDGSMHPHVVSYERLIAAFNAGDFETVTSILDPQLVYTIPGNSPIAGTTRGVEAHVGALRRAKELSGGTLRFTPKSILRDGHTLVVVGRIQAKRGERLLDSDHLALFRFEGDRIAEGRTIPIDLYAFDAFWG
jgi:uncharacterized protein